MFFQTRFVSLSNLENNLCLSRSIVFSVQPISAASAGSQPTSTGRPMDNIFSKISRLNEALHSINPKYKPIGFSITSIESCSSSILQDAIFATETAVSTLMSVIGKARISRTVLLPCDNFLSIFNEPDLISVFDYITK